MQRAFTVGNVATYDPWLTAPRPLIKIGRREVSEEWHVGYVGGWAWRTREEADAFAAAPHATYPTGQIRLKVYGLVLPTSWEEDVSPEPGDDGVHHLLHDAVVVALDAVGGAADPAG